MRTFVLAALGAGALGATAQAQTTAAGTPVFAVRSGRPVVTLADGNFTIQPIARFDLDFGGFWDQPRYPGNKPPQFLDSDRAGVPANGINVRRGRVGLQGTYLKDFTYTFTWELAPGPGKQFDPQKNSKIFELQTAYTGLGWGTLRVGGFTLNHTLEFATSSFETLLLERPAIVNIATSLASGDTRLAGGLEAKGDRWFAAGYATGGVLSTLNDANQRGLVGRAVGLAVNESDYTLAIGFNAAAQFHPGTSPGPQSVRLRDYPELRLEPTRLLDSATIKAGSGYAFGPEISGKAGPVLLTGEYQRVEIDANAGAPNRSFEGWYATASTPLWGEGRRWDGARAVWTRPRVQDLNPEGNTWGWAEAVVRYSSATLNDHGVRGGRQGVTSVGLNYYPTSRLRASAQYSNGTVRLDGPDRAFQAFAMRLSFNW
ncbi:MAG: OprO/OprP family phosphate-selective porin [Paracraurococcus sp.]